MCRQILKIEFECKEEYKDAIQEKLRQLTGRPYLKANRAYNNYCACEVFIGSIGRLEVEINNYFESIREGESSKGGATVSFYAINIIRV